MVVQIDFQLSHTCLVLIPHSNTEVIVISDSDYGPEVNQVG